MPSNKPNTHVVESSAHSAGQRNDYVAPIHNTPSSASTADASENSSAAVPAEHEVNRQNKAKSGPSGGARPKQAGGRPQSGPRNGAPGGGSFFDRNKRNNPSICKFFAAGSCKNGDACNFAHVMPAEHAVNGGDASGDHGENGARAGSARGGRGNAQSHARGGKAPRGQYQPRSQNGDANGENPTSNVHADAGDVAKLGTASTAPAPVAAHRTPVAPSAPAVHATPAHMLGGDAINSSAAPQQNPRAGLIAPPAVQARKAPAAFSPNQVLGGAPSQNAYAAPFVPGPSASEQSWLPSQPQQSSQFGHMQAPPPAQQQFHVPQMQQFAPQMQQFPHQAQMMQPSPFALDAVMQYLAASQAAQRSGQPLSPADQAALLNLQYRAQQAMVQLQPQGLVFPPQQQAPASFGNGTPMPQSPPVAPVQQTAPSVAAYRPPHVNAAAPPSTAPAVSTSNLAKPKGPHEDVPTNGSASPRAHGDGVGNASGSPARNRNSDDDDYDRNHPRYQAQAAQRERDREVQRENGRPRPRVNSDHDEQGGARNQDRNEAPRAARPRKIYARDPETEKMLFTEDQKRGINFDKYDDIPVETTGNNVPEPISRFEEGHLHPLLLENLALAQFDKPTPVQKNALPVLMAGRDIMACAQTGSGKTGAFLFPYITRLLEGHEPQPQSTRSAGGSFAGRRRVCPSGLILAPTRELATQIFEEAMKFTYRTDIKPVVVYGGRDIGEQIRQLDKGCDLLVATPGRLVDLVGRKKISLSNVTYLVFDEADRMLDMGFEPQIRHIVEECDMRQHDRQTLMFSATFPKEIQKLALDFLDNYVFLAVGRVGSSSELITQKVEYVEDHEKRERLMYLLPKCQGLTLIFVERKTSADILEEYLIKEGVNATSIHGDRTQEEREYALAMFRCGRFPVLVATDVAARGLDIPNVLDVINYDMPNTIDDYVHRIGRTGRCGNVGTAVAFINEKNRPILRDLYDMLKENKQQIPSWFEQMVDFSAKGQWSSMGARRGGRGGSSRSGDRFASKDVRDADSYAAGHKQKYRENPPASTPNAAAGPSAGNGRPAPKPSSGGAKKSESNSWASLDMFSASRGGNYGSSAGNDAWD